MTGHTEYRIYPAIFRKDGSGTYIVDFPDLPGCMTSGDSLENAYRMAKEALTLWLDGTQAPAPTPMENIHAETGDTIMLVEADSGEDIEHFDNTLVSETIEKQLREKNYTKYQMAKILGVDRSYITHIIKGDRRPSVEMAKRIGTLLDFDWRIFYGDQIPA